jgi:hypothetical protein
MKGKKPCYRLSISEICCLALLVISCFLFTNLVGWMFLMFYYNNNPTKNVITFSTLDCFIITIPGIIVSAMVYSCVGVAKGKECCCGISDEEYEVIS